MTASAHTSTIRTVEIGSASVVGVVDVVGVVLLGVLIIPGAAAV